MRALLLLALTIIATACATRPAPPSAPVAPDDEEVQAGIHAEREAGGRDFGKARTETFLVSYTIDYGYDLSPPNDTNAVVTPVFNDPLVEMSFNHYFESEEFANSLGKKTYCECYGVRFKVGGGEHFRILRARIYSQ